MTTLSEVKLLAVPADSSSGDVPSSDGNGGVTWAPGTGMSIPTGQVQLNVVQTPKSNIRWNHIAQASTDYGCAEISSSGTQFDEIVFEKYLQAGSYTLDLFHRLNTNRGIYSIYIDDVLQGTVDGKGVSGTQVHTPLAATVVGDGLHEIKLVMATKNAASTAYFGDISGLTLTRTGA